MSRGSGSSGSPHRGLGSPAERRAAERLADVELESTPGPVLSAALRVFAPELSAGNRKRWDRWVQALRLLRPLGAISAGNAVRVFADGDELLEAQWAGMDAAKFQIVMTMYIFADDEVGRRTRDGLAAAARRGVDVALQLDAFASPLDEDFLAPLKAAGVHVAWFNPILRWRSRYSRLVRNHRKLLAIDGRVGYAGGMNISEEYGGERYGNGRFRDTNIEVRGPAARDLGQLAASTFEPPPPIVLAADAKPGEVLVQVLESHVRRERRAIQKALRLTIEHASERVWLTSPYFVPPQRIMRTLESAAGRGVDVRVLTAGLSDVPIVRRASQHLYGRLLGSGIRIFELEARTLHSKTAVVDGVWGSVGSFNLDLWSYRRNLEVTVAVLDSDLAVGLERAFEADLEGAREVRLGSWLDRPWWQRLSHWIAFQLMRI
ncbi:MAG: phospholipase D-like domain-containing protein [Planctomycetota bacterium]